MLSSAAAGQDLKDISITIELNNDDIRTLFQRIENQTPLRFAYNQEEVDSYGKITIPVASRSVKELLDIAFKKTLLRYRQSNNNVIVYKIKQEKKDSTTQYNRIKIQGKVTDKAGNLLPGVSIFIKGTNVGTTTNAEGAYSLEAADDDLIVYSFIGYKTLEVSPEAMLVLDVVLEEDTNILDEVVINGGYYETSDKLKTGSIIKIPSKDIENQPITSPLLALHGRVAGLDITTTTGAPGGAPKIRIRGNNSLRENGSYPLYIIDGVPIDSSPIPTVNGMLTGGFDPFSTVNPSNIESIEILKDGDATAIYGSRGANGVIIIKTKKPVLKSGTGFNVGYYSGIGQISQRMKLLTRQQYLTMRKEAFRNDGVTPSVAPGMYDMTVWDTTRTTDWQGVLLGQTSRIMDLQTNLSGGNSSTSFQFGGGYHSETMAIPGDFRYQRMNGKISLKHASSDQKFQALMVANYGRDKNILPSDLNLINLALQLPPVAPALYDSKGDLNFQPLPNGISTWENPLAGLKKESKSTISNLIANANVSYEILTGLSVKFNLGYTDIIGNEVNKTPLASMRPEYRVNGYGYSVFGFNRRSSWIVEPQLNFNKKYKEHTIESLLGSTFQEVRAVNQQTNAIGYTSDTRLEDLSGATSYSVSDSKSQYKYASVFFRASYNYKSKYLLSLTGRRDGSSRFAPQNRFGNFGSIGVAWIFSNEECIKRKFSFLNFGKMRSSFAVTGNDQIGDYQYYNVYTAAPSNYQSGSSLVPKALYNPKYAWEATKKIEAAIELSFLENRITTEINYYFNQSSNQLIDYSLPATTGFPTVITNFNATIANRGLEIMLNTINIDKDNSFQWTTTFNYSLPKIKLIKFDGIENSAYSNIYKVGSPLSIRYLYIYTGIDPQTGKATFEDVNEDGVINYKDQKLMQPVGKKYYGGLVNTFRYKTIEFSFLIQFTHQYLPRHMLSPPGASANQPVRVMQRWQEEGDITNQPKFTQNFNEDPTIIADNNKLISSTYNYEDASFIRLKTAALAYTFSGDTVKKIKVRSAKIYVQAQNIFTSTKYVSLDPETGTGGIPPLRIFTFGMQVSL